MIWARQYFRILVISILVFCPKIGRAELFQPYFTIPTDSSAQALAVGDVNADGRDDVVVVGETPELFRDLAVFLQGTTGELQAPVKYPISPSPQMVWIRGSVDIGDLNNDGRNDVIVTMATDLLHPDGIGVFLQDPAGGLKPVVFYPASQSSFQVRTGDFNDDGLLDVVSIGSERIDIFLQNRKGTLEPPVAYEAVLGIDLEVGDVNGDGLTDIVCTSNPPGTRDIAIFLQNGGGTFDPVVYYDIEGNDLDPVEVVAVGDVNGDSLLDVIVANGRIGVLAQNSSGSLDPIVYYGSSVRGPISTADVTRSGREDILVAHGAYSTLGVYVQDKDNGLLGEELQSIPYQTFMKPQSLATGDINDDGLLDVTIANESNGLVLLYGMPLVETAAYFPLESGNSWSYLLNGGLEDSLLVLPGTVKVNDADTKVMEHADGYRQFFTNDSTGIRLHREYDPSLYIEGVGTFQSTITFSPPLVFAAPVMTVGEEIQSSGTASFAFSGLGTYPLNYSATSVAEAIETIVVPFGSFKAGRLKVTIAFEGMIGLSPFSMTLIQTNWVALGVGVVKSLENDGTTINTMELTATSIPVADVVINTTDSPDPVRQGQKLTYTLTVANNGPDTATGIVVTDTLPDGVDFISASPGCTKSAGKIQCSIDDLANDAVAILTVVVIPSFEVVHTNHARVVGNEADPNIDNNLTIEQTTILPKRKTMPWLLLLL